MKPVSCSECGALVDRIREAVAGHLRSVAALQQATLEDDLNRRSLLETVARLSHWGRKRAFEQFVEHVLTQHAESSPTM